jgi:3-hydroxyisobutyrate dehydrogenase-like beta-hydroxyacid dehydrogenase
VVNAAVAPMVALLAEAVALGDRLGLDRDVVLDELARSRIGPLVARKRAKIATGRYEPDVTLATFGKDLGLLARTAGDLPMPMAAAARDRVAAALAAGLGDRDYSVLVAHALGTACG